MGKYGGDGDSYYWDIQLKIYLLLNFNVFFQFLLTKFLKGELFSCLQKVDHVIKRPTFLVSLLPVHLLLSNIKFLYNVNDKLHSAYCQL